MTELSPQLLIVSDGKPGHLNQSLGLADALQRARPGLVIDECAPLSRRCALQALLTGRLSPDLLPSPARPALLLGAGHATHLTLLALKRLWQVPAVVLMQPSLPLAWFDLCLIPAHDAPAQRSNVLVTQGALNRMRPGAKTANSGMILVGGPSRNAGWDEALLLSQIEFLLQQKTTDWCLTSSRRTPAATEQQLQARYGAVFVPATQTARGWLPEQLAHTRQCWVTEDSVSMVYEALSAGCAVGTLPVPGADNRLKRGLQKLADQGIITPFQAWQGEPLAPPRQQFDEAGRCAEQILNRGWI